MISPGTLWGGISLPAGSTSRMTSNRSVLTSVLVTNDDGIASPGIHALVAALAGAGHDVVCVAPRDDRSGSAAAIGRIDPDEQTANVLSLPRDLWIPISDTGKKARINSAHARGEQVLIDTIQDNFGIAINHYVEIDFVGFERLVDAVGGIPLWFEDPVRDTHTGLSVTEPGCQCRRKWSVLQVEESCRRSGRLPGSRPLPSGVRRNGSARTSATARPRRTETR